jgi:hypothetical protein
MRPIPVRAAATVAVVLLPLALGSCSLFKSSPKSPPAGLVASTCPPGNCVINVSVTGTCQSPGDISVDKPLISASAAVNMRWVISPSSFSFASNGIQFDPADSQFEVKPSSSPNEFRIMNQHRSSGTFYYYLNIQGCAQADPWIRNE